MKISATQKHARMSPRKIRPYAKMVQGMSAVEAQNQLSFAVGKAPGLILEVLKSAVANAKNNVQIPEADLRVASILVNQGLVMKRFMPAAKGMAHAILKRTAHITVIVEGEAQGKQAGGKEKIATLTAGEYVAEEQKEAKKEEALQQSQGKKEHEGHDHEDHLEKHETEERSVETVADKKAQAFQKIKMNQKGADKKKTHRRKSIG